MESLKEFLEISAVISRYFWRNTKNSKRIFETTDGIIMKGFMKDRFSEKRLQ